VKPYIVVTNDDGVNAPGILALAQAMGPLGEIRVIGPARNQSASGHKKTLFQDMAVRPALMADGQTTAVAVEGSPADSIALAALGVIAWPPRLVVSGINRGANMGQDITYSGTVTAALEATIQGVPALAFSLDDHNADRVEDYAGAARIAVQVVQAALARPLPAFTILNVNIPAGPVKGIRLTRQGIRVYADALQQVGEVCQIVGDAPGGLTDEEGTDLWALHHGYASITPIHLDMTAHRFLADLAAWELT
jgi:5'-nucleotidase